MCFSGSFGPDLDRTQGRLHWHGKVTRVLPARRLIDHLLSVSGMVGETLFLVSLFMFITLSGPDPDIIKREGAVGFFWWLFYPKIFLNKKNNKKGKRKKKSKVLRIFWCRLFYPKIDNQIIKSFKGDSAPVCQKGGRGQFGLPWIRSLLDQLLVLCWLMVLLTPRAISSVSIPPFHRKCYLIAKHSHVPLQTITRLECRYKAPRSSMYQHVT